MYGWIDVNSNNDIQEVSVKKSLNDSKKDHVILGIFTFKNLSILKECLESLFIREEKINNEYYMDSAIQDAINLGLKCKVFEVDSFLCWGTPNDYKTFKYWQSCFHLWDSHEYDISRDERIKKTEQETLRSEILDWNIKDYFK